MEHNEMLQKIEMLEQKVEALEKSRPAGLRAFLKRAFTRTSVLVGVAVAALATGAIIYAAQNVFIDGTVISADAVNNNFTELYNAMPVRDTARGLVIKNNATNPNFQMDINADEIILQDTNGKSIRVTSVDLTVDITVSGANGLDTGSEANTWYHIWVIYDSSSSTTAGLLSTSATAPTMPSGYTYKAYTGAVYNASNFISITQIGNTVGIRLWLALSGGYSTSITSIDLSSRIPVTAKKVTGFVDNNSSSGWIFPDSSELGAIYLNNVGTGATSLAVNVALLETQMIYYRMSTGSMYLYITGWEY